MRYILDYHIDHLYEGPAEGPDANVRVELGWPRSVTKIFVDIIDETEFSWKVRAFLPDGEIKVGWTPKCLNGVKLDPDCMEEMLDGRFNSDRVT